MAENSSTASGIGFLGLLVSVFITMKLFGTIDWSWWWVLSPLLALFAFFLLAICVHIILKVTE